MWGRCQAPHNACPRTVLCLDKTLIFGNVILTLAFRALHAWGFEVWLLNGCGLNLCFLKAFRQILDFHGENPTTCHLLSWWKLGITLPQVTWIVTIAPKGASRYIYMCIHHAQSKHTEQGNKCLHPQRMAQNIGVGK